MRLRRHCYIKELLERQARKVHYAMTRSLAAGVKPDEWLREWDIGSGERAMLNLEYDLVLHGYRYALTHIRTGSGYNQPHWSYNGIVLDREIQNATV
jgi:hypothetical protein